MIPKVFHQIWLGPHDLPSEMARFRETWRCHHPDWDWRLWRDDDFGWLRNRALFERATSYGQKADIAKYEVIERHGGIYLDTDMECLRSISPLLGGVEAFAGWEPDGGVGVAVFGSLPGHKLLREVVATLPAWCLVHENKRIPRRIDLQTGPELFTHVVRRRRWTAKAGVAIFPTDFFYPYNWTEPWRADDRFPDAFAVHRWKAAAQEQEGIDGQLSDLVPTSLLDARMTVSTLAWDKYIALRRRIPKRPLASLKRRLGTLTRS